MVSPSLMPSSAETQARICVERALDVAGGAVADAEFIFAGFGAFELGVECEDALDFSGRDAEMLGGRQDAVVRDVSFAGLDELEPLDQVALVGLHFSRVRRR